MKHLVLQFVTILLIIPLASCWGQQPKGKREAWLGDLEFLEQSVADIFPGFETHLGSKLFLQELSAIRQKLDVLSQKEIVYGIQKALGFLGDEGCNVLPFQEILDTGIMPVSIYPFQNDWYICDAKDKLLVGQRIIGVDGRPIEDVFDMVKPYLNADNEHYQKRLFAVYGLLPDLLRVVGLEGSDSSVTLQLSGDTEVLVEAGLLSDYNSLNRGLPNDGNFKRTQKNHQDENYWMEHVPDSKVLFIQFQQIANNEQGPSFKKFVNLIAEKIDNGSAQKIILDLRYGGGGNGFKLKPLTDLLRDSEQINQDGNLILLTSKATKGTLLELASILTLNTQAVIVGEPTGEGPNTVGDTKIVQMPNSKINISLTKVFWPTSWEIDERSTLKPDIDVDFSFEDYINGKDPWLDTAMIYESSEHFPSIDISLMEKLSGNYDIQGRKVALVVENNGLAIKMSRRMKSFFEFNAGLYQEEEGILTSTIKGVKLNYKTENTGEVELMYLDWMGTKLDIQNK